MGSDAGAMITKLEADFRAARVAEDEISASDLAFSLSQDLSVADDLLREGGHLAVCDTLVPIVALGHNFIEAGNYLAPSHRAVTVMGEAKAPRSLPDVFLARLRRLGRARAEVQVAMTSGGKVAGVLVRATPEHVVVSGIHRTAIPMSEIAYVRIDRGGSADEL